MALCWTGPANSNRPVRRLDGSGLAKAQAIKNAFQIVRAQMYLSSVTASEGRSADSERQASTAVNTALAEGLDVGGGRRTGRFSRRRWWRLGARPTRPDIWPRRSSWPKGAGPVELRPAARLQTAALHVDQGRPAQALEVLPTPALEQFKGHNYLPPLRADGADDCVSRVSTARRHSTGARDGERRPEGGRGDAERRAGGARARQSGAAG